MDELYTKFDAVFFEKTRLSLMTIIYRKEMATFNALKKAMRLTDGALYTHLEKLIAAGYVTKKKEVAGMTVRTIYMLTREGKQAFLTYLEFLKEMVKSMEVEDEDDR